MYIIIICLYNVHMCMYMRVCLFNKSGHIFSSFKMISDAAAVDSGSLARRVSGEVARRDFHASRRDA